eukprot:Amastigsp_a19912_3.p2 type:complete len:116 gc:universal Amastigsp_a19912_3:67-414(+)
MSNSRTSRMRKLPLTTSTCRSSKAATSSSSSTKPSPTPGPATRAQTNSKPILLPRHCSSATCLSRCQTRTSTTSSVMFAMSWMSVWPLTGGPANPEALLTQTSLMLLAPPRPGRF